jgi:hypothetical protein
VALTSTLHPRSILYTTAQFSVLTDC